MPELLEEIKKLPREEQLALADQIYGWEGAAPVEDEVWQAELVRRAHEALQNPGKGLSWEEVEARLRAQDENGNRG